MNAFLPFAALPIAAIAAWYAAPEFAPSEPGRYVVPPVKQIEDPTALMEARARTVEKPDIRLKAFLPQVPPKPPAEEPTLVLHSVLTGAGVSLATINGQVVKPGDKVGPYWVKRITADGVDLLRDGKTRHLPMRPLHELPPPSQPGAGSMRTMVSERQNEAELARDFWKIFDN